jgi:endonuclease/exonuclease/phosphatase family metal-dependent hydrolase
MRRNSIGFIVLLVLLGLTSAIGKCLVDGDYGHTAADYAQRLFSYSPASGSTQASTSADLKFMTINQQSGFLTNCNSDPTTQATHMQNVDYVGTQETVQNVDTRCNRCNIPKIIADVAGMNTRFVMAIPWRTGQYGLSAGTSQQILETKWALLNYPGVEQRVVVALKTQPAALKGRTLWFLDAHIEYYNANARYSQLDQILAFINNDIADPTAVIVIVGDFNGGPWDRGYTTMKSNNFQNSWEKFYGSILEGNTIPADWPGSRFDHIWYREPAGVTIRVKHAEVPNVRLSDHRPVIATLSFTVAGTTPAVSSGSGSVASSGSTSTSTTTGSSSSGGGGSSNGESVVCVGPIWENNPVTIKCPNIAQKVSQVQFASYGNPTGTCGNFKLGSCVGGSSMAVVLDKCLNRNSCTFPIANNVFGDPCPNNGKHFYAQVVCK